MTQRAFLVGIIGGCFYVITLLNGLPSYFSVLTWLSISILVSSGGVALLSLQGLKCEWRVVRAAATEAVHLRSLPVGAAPNAEAAAKARHEARMSPTSDATSESSRDGEAVDATTASDAATTAATGPSIEVRLTNAGTLSKANILLDVRLKNLRTDTRITRRFLVEALPSGTSVSSVLTLPYLPRGRYEISELRIIGSDVLGLFRASSRIAAARNAQDSDAAAVAKGQKHSWSETSGINELVVGPAVQTALSGGGAGGAADTQGADSAATSLHGRGDELRGTRPYVAGDDLRTVHWRSTARMGHLVVKEFHSAAQPECAVLWDGASLKPEEALRHLAHDEPSDIEDAVENGLRLTASLCRTIVERGLHCTLLRLDREPAFISTRGGGRATPPVGHAGARAAMLTTLPQSAFWLRCNDALADAVANRESPLSEAVQPFIHLLDTNSELFLITASLEEDVRNVALSLRQRGLRVAVGLVALGPFETAPDTNPSGAAGAPERRGLRYPGRRDKRHVPDVLSSRYREQVEALNRMGIRAIVLRPSGGASIGASPTAEQARINTGGMGSVYQALTRLLDGYSNESGFSGAAKQAEGPASTVATSSR